MNLCTDSNPGDLPEVYKHHFVLLQVLQQPAEGLLVLQHLELPVREDRGDDDRADALELRETVVHNNY